MPKSDPVLAREDQARATVSMETLGENLSRLTKEGDCTRSCSMARCVVTPAGIVA